RFPLLFLFSSGSRALSSLHSFPTRRSSDLDRSFTYKKLNSAMTAVQNGAKLVVMNPDPNYPIPGGYMSDTMAIARAIETASSQRSEEHTSELQSRFDLVCRLLLEKKEMSRK